MALSVVRFTALEELVPLADDWDRLSAGVPFRSWAWMSTWWNHYGQSPGGPAKSLYVLGVFDSSKRLMGIAPCYLERSIPWGEVRSPISTIGWSRLTRRTPLVFGREIHRGAPRRPCG